MVWIGLDPGSISGAVGALDANGDYLDSFMIEPTPLSGTDLPSTLYPVIVVLRKSVSTVTRSGLTRVQALTRPPSVALYISRT